MTFRTASLTHAGGRSSNQDAFAFQAREAGMSVWVVCDGVGGHRKGEVASRLAADAILKSSETASVLGLDVMNEAVIAAKDAILSHEHDAEPSGMRSTAVVAMSDGVSVMFGHMGDSRGYLIRDSSIIHLTQDHSVVMALHAGGQITYADIRTHPDRNKITRALGKEEDVNPTITPEPIALQAGDAILLCSDGVWEHVTDPETVFDLCKSDDPESWLLRLFERVMVRADIRHDNLTALAVWVS